MAVPYKAFDQVIIRSPFYPLNYFYEQLARFQDDIKHFDNFVRDPRLQESICIASSGLFSELQKWLGNELPAKETDRLRYSVMRYLTRSATRCTPFGLFAGCCLGRLGDRTEIVLAESMYKSRTRLDMDYLCALAAHIAGIPEVKGHLLYFPNTSLYRLGDKFRYVEYFYNNARRTHRLSEVDASAYLEKIIARAVGGARMDQLIALLVGNDEVSYGEASQFINELIDEQVLVSELEPAVTGAGFLEQLLYRLRQVAENAGGDETINGLVNRLETIDGLLNDSGAQSAGQVLPVYDRATAEVNTLGVEFDRSCLFQTDMLTGCTKATLGRDVENAVREAMRLFNRITPPSGETRLSGFISAFRNRYEDREVPLLQALDNESGVGYQGGAGDINELVDDLAMVAKSSGRRSVEWNSIQAVLLKKYAGAVAGKEYSITITEEDVAHLPERWDDLPPTMSFMCEIVAGDDGGFMVCLESSGGSGAANLLGRFCHLDPQIEEFTKQIAGTEAGSGTDAIFAEIVHLPESRLGNVLSRPVLRPYEIPYLARPAVEHGFQIPLSELAIAYRNGRLVLRSVRLGKEVIPRLSTAHNFNSGAMPVYQFLCDMQLQNCRGGIGFHWGAIFNEYTWLPRVQYKNVILSPARWHIKKEAIKDFMEAGNDRLTEAVTTWRRSLCMPRYVMLADGDNRLFADMENAVSIRTLFSAIKKRSSFYLREFLFDPGQGVVTNENGDVFCNEFILSFYKTAYSRAEHSNAEENAYAA